MINLTLSKAKTAVQLFIGVINLSTTEDKMSVVGRRGSIVKTEVVYVVCGTKVGRIEVRQFLNTPTLRDDYLFLFCLRYLFC
jgi:hypothetical protein